MPRRVPVCARGDGGGGSRGCKSTPDTANVSEIQPSMERHTSVVHVQALTAKRTPLPARACAWRALHPV